MIYTLYVVSGRDKLLESLGISVDSIISKGDALALSELRLKYFAPLKNGDRFVVKTKLMEIKGVRIIFEHIIETLADHKVCIHYQSWEHTMCSKHKLVKFVVYH